MVEELELECSIDPENARMSIAKQHNSEDIIVSCHEFGDDTDVALNKHQARQLHEWLGRYLENSDG